MVGEALGLGVAALALARAGVGARVAGAGGWVGIGVGAGRVGVGKVDCNGLASGAGDPPHAAPTIRIPAAAVILITLRVNPKNAMCKV